MTQTPRKSTAERVYRAICNSAVFAAILGLTAIPAWAQQESQGSDEATAQPSQEQAAADANSDKPEAMSDAHIRNAIRQEFLVSAAVPYEQIAVNVNEGIATLTGSVSNLLAKDRAAKIAQTIRGVRAVVNNLAVNPRDNYADAEIETKAEQALLLDAATDAWEVDVTVTDQVATLNGTVDSYQASKLAERVVKGVRGLKGIENQLVVQVAENRPDDQIRAEIEGALRADVLIDDHLIDVTVQDGVANLSGLVGSAAEKSEAIMDAWVAGVETVDASELEVKDWARDPDVRKNKFADLPASEIADAIEQAWLYDPRIFAFDLSAEVSDGIATLKGEVDNLRAKQAAAQDARNTVGVLGVNNQIEVQGPQIPDEDIAANILLGITDDPFVDETDISVSVDDGNVDLHGTVDSYFEKAQAADVAARMTGVESVDNLIEVNLENDVYAYDPYVEDWYVEETDWYAVNSDAPEESDEEIKESIESQFFWSPFVDGGDIVISVNNGKVTLTGNVDSWSERMAATENAIEGGAIEVVNDLVIL